MRTLLSFTLLTSMLAVPAFAQPAARRAAPAPAPAAAMDTEGEAAMLARINALRAEEGAPALERHAGLDAAAQAHSIDMAQHRELVHVSERTGDPGRRVREANVATLRVGENIARAATTQAAFASILGSEAHRAQLLDTSFSHIGLASVSGPDGMYITQVFASLAPAPAELPPPAVTETTPEPAEAEPAPAAPPAPEAQPAPVPAPPSTPTAVPPAPQAQAQAQARVPGPQPVPTMRVPRRHRRAAGYWLFHGQRWWYFPVPRNARPGMLLRPDPRVQGPPPGYRPRRPIIQARPVPPPPVYRPQGQVPPPPQQQPRPQQQQQQIYWY